MEEAVRKRGVLYIQQQKFGKRWKKVWSLAYGDSGCAVARLELFECRGDAERSERKRSKRESRKVIRTSDFVRVSEVNASACPRGCGSFVVETTEKSFRFAAETSELKDWVRTLCEIAFPMNQGQCDDLKICSVQDSECSGMVENSIYCTSTALKDFEVTVKKTEASERCHLHGAFILRVDFHGLHLQNPESGVIHFTWPYRCIRKFGLNMLSFSFEAGRKSDSGEGLFELKTRHNDRIFQAVDAAIDLQSRERQASDPGCRPVLPDVSDLYSRVNKARRPCPPVDGLLAGVEEMTLDHRVLPFRDWGRGMSSHPLPNPDPHLEPSQVSKLPRPLYQELAGLGPEPDYEEVDIGAMAAVLTQAPLTLYDDIKEVKGHAWSLGMASDPVEQECPSNPGADEHAIPRQLKRMLTNPRYDYSKEDTDAGEQIMTHL